MEDFYLDAHDASDAELEELVLESYLGGLSFDPQVTEDAATKERRQSNHDTPEGSEVRVSTSEDMHGLWLVSSSLAIGMAIAMLASMHHLCTV